MNCPQFQMLLLVGTLLLAGILAAGCGPQKSSSPAIPDSTLIPLLAELHLARARRDIQQDLPPSIRDSIFQRYETDSASLARTLSYYTEHPEEYMRIYEEVAFHLQEQRRDTVDRTGAAPGSRRAGR